MSRYLTFLYPLVLVAVFLLPARVSADDDVVLNALVNVPSVDHMDLSIKYHVIGIPEYVILPTNTSGKGLNGHITLENVYGTNGGQREIQGNKDGLDAVVEVSPGDTYITANYRVDSVLADPNVGLFFFPLILGSVLPPSAHVDIRASSTLSVVSYSGSALPSPVATTTISTFLATHDRDTSILTPNNLEVLVYKKNQTADVKKDVGNFTVIAPIDRIDRVVAAVSEIQSYEWVYQTLFNRVFPSKINLVISDVSKTNVTDYEPEGFTVEPGNIFISPDAFSQYVPSILSKKVLAHELAHVITNPFSFFSYGSYKANWFSEGLAVFAEEYISDNFFSKEKETNTAALPAGLSQTYEKFNIPQLKKEYTYPFDYDFKIDTDGQNIADTYTHAGLIFYNLYLRNPLYVTRAIGLVDGASAAVNCDTCDTDYILGQLSTMTGMSRNDIVYPYKNNLDKPDKILSTLTIPVVDTSAADAITKAFIAAQTALATSSKATSTDDLLARLKSFISTQPTATTTVSTVAGYTFTKNLSVGTTDPDVKRLQQFLNAKGFVIATSGTGSTGKEGTYFGNATKNALTKYQKSVNIQPASGYFGTLTRAYVSSH